MVIPVPPRLAAVGAPVPATTPVTGEATAESAPIASLLPSALLGSVPPMPVNTLPLAVLLGLPAILIASSVSATGFGTSSKILMPNMPLATMPSTLVAAMAKLSLTLILPGWLAALLKV